MLVSDVLDRTLSNWLWPAGVDRPSFDLLAGAITAGSPATGGALVLSGVIEGQVPDHSILEIDAELIQLRTGGASPVVQDRGWLDTTPASHADGTKVYLNPKYTRKALLNGLRAVVGMLYGEGLYVRKTDTAQTWSTTATKQLPTGGKEILSILVRRAGSERYDELTVEGKHWCLYRQFDPPKYHLVQGGSQGQALTVAYKTDFTLPASEADDLTTLSVPESLQEHLPFAVAGYLLQSREIPRVQIAEITRMLAAAGIQVGTALNVGQAMLRAFRLENVAAERRKLRELDPVRVAITR